MKPLFTLLLIASGLLAKSAPCANVAPQAVRAFEAAYGKNTAASWTCTAEGCQVEFELKGQRITAVYAHNGQLRWYKRHVLSTQLPVTLQMALKNRMNGYWISDVVEQSGKQGTVYLLTLENASKKVTMKAAGSNWLLSKTTAKA